MQRPALLVIVRHAESVRNQVKKESVYFADDAARRVLRGTPDQLIDLTADGHEQAAQTGRALRDRFGAFDYVYTSGYARTEQTAEWLLSAYTDEERAQTRMRMNLFVRERDSGYTYDMTEAEAEAAFPWLEEYWRTFGGFFSRPPGGESLADVVGRVHMFLEILFRDRIGQKVLVVTRVEPAAGPGAGQLRCDGLPVQRERRPSRARRVQPRVLDRRVAGGWPLAMAVVDRSRTLVAL